MAKKHPRICKICLKAIGGKEHYCTLKEYNEAKEVGVGHYHVSCFRSRFMNFSKIQNEANSVLATAKNIMERLQ